MKNTITLLRISYGWGIIADGVVAFLMLFPELFVRFMKIDLVPDANLRYGLINGAPLMIGWTLLLLWASRKPIERKAILLLTIPVVAGYVLVELYAISSGLTSFGQALPLFIQQAGMTALFLFSCFKTMHQGE